MGLAALLAVLLLMPVLLAGYWRIQSFLFARKVHRILSSLAQVHIDETTEAQMLALVPGLTGARVPRTGSGQEEDVVSYWAAVSNDEEWNWWVFHLPIRSLGCVVSDNPAMIQMMPCVSRIAYWLGWRYQGFGIRVWVRNGIVSTVSTGLDRDIQLGSPRFGILEIRSMHSPGYWQRITDVDEDNPGIFMRGDLHVAYTKAAPPEFIKQLYQWDLSCYYLGFRGCQTRDLVPQLLRSKQEMEERTARRKKAGDQCPDRILAGRVSQRLALDVELLEVVKSPDAEGTPSRLAYRLTEVLHGRSWEARFAEYPWIDPRPAPLSEFKPGDRVVMFSGENFESCNAVRATPSAIQAMRDAVPARTLGELREDRRPFVIKSF